MGFTEEVAVAVAVAVEVELVVTSRLGTPCDPIKALRLRDKGVRSPSALLCVYLCVYLYVYSYVYSYVYVYVYVGV